MKYISNLIDNSLYIFTLFLIAFIPLYPKLPLLGVTGTWVYIRLEDIFIAIAGGLLALHFFRRRDVLKSPVSKSIIIFWVVGLISTLFAVFVLFPHLANTSPKLAFLHYIRRIEYLLPFFLAFTVMSDKKRLKGFIITILITLVLVAIYGFGQKITPDYFFAFSTMNEEFAKGVPLRLSSLARIPSTFAGHYDLAAYLVLVIPLVGSLVLGVKKWWYRLLLVGIAIAGLCLLLLTESRISYAVYLITMSFMLFIHDKKKWIIPVIVASMVITIPFQGIVERLSSTITQVDQVVDARTGKVIGIAKENENDKIVIEDTLSTGENLPQGSSYISLPSSSAGKGASSVTFKRLNADGGIVTDELKGEFGIKKGYAFDVSWTTRFQGEWPRAIDAFKRNIFLGSGYSSISLATDGDYLRLLGEVGMLGFASFMIIFLTYYLYVYKILPDVSDPLARSYILGVSAGIFGLLLNAVLIDVFEASKVAYTTWFLIGSSVGLLALYQKREFIFTTELKNALLSPLALGGYLFALVVGVWSTIMGNFFIGDDFTWLRWVADCPKIVVDGVSTCDSMMNTFLGYFTKSDGFFYRPGTKVLFSLLYSVGSLNPFSYHLASLIFHAMTCVSLFFMLLQVTKRKWFSFAIAISFVMASGYHETIFWIASMGHVIASYCIVTGLLFYILWREKKNILLLIISLLHVFAAPLFQEMGIVAPLVILFYELFFYREYTLKRLWILGVYLLQIPLYLSMRFISQSHWGGGDYSYNLLKLPFNSIGNALGVAGIGLFGVVSIPFYGNLRAFLREDLLLAGILGSIILILLAVVTKFFWKRVPDYIRKYSLFFFLLFIIPLLPFLGLGNMSERYSYLATAGVLGLVATLGLWIYETLKQYKITPFILTGVVLFFLTFHYFQIQRLSTEWAVAGRLTETTIAGVTQVHKTDPEGAMVTYYFVDTPLKYKSAWVFPVGLSDAIWLALQNKPITVKQKANLSDALRESSGNTNAHILRFNTAGELEEIIHE